MMKAIRAQQAFPASRTSSQESVSIPCGDLQVARFALMTGWPPARVVWVRAGLAIGLAEMRHAQGVQ